MGWGLTLLPGAGGVQRLSSSNPGISGNVFDFFFFPYPTYLRGRVQTSDRCIRFWAEMGLTLPSS